MRNNLVNILSNNSFKNRPLVTIIQRVNKKLGRCYARSKNINSVNIDLCSICNLSCVICQPFPSFDKHKVGTQMSFSDFRLIFDEIIDTRYKKIVFCPLKGEVFLNKDIWPILHYANKAKMRYFRVVTNFIPIKRNHIKKLFLLDKLTVLQISIYGYDLKSFSGITRKGLAQFEKLKENLRALNNIDKHRDRPFSILIKWWIGGNVSSFNESKDELKFLVLNLIDKEKGDKLLVKNNVCKMPLMGPEDISVINRTGLKAKKRVKNFEKYGVCRYLFTDTGINLDSSVTTCRCFARNEGFFLGNIREKPIDFILSGKNPIFKKIISEQENNIFKYPCNTCSEYKSIYYPTGEMISRSELKKRYGV